MNEQLAARVRRLVPAAQAALLPSLVASPAELTAANVASSTLESVGTFLGPALGGLLLAVSSPAVVFAANGLTFLWSALLVLGLRHRDPPRERASEAGARDVSSGVLAGSGQSPRVTRTWRRVRSARRSPSARGAGTSNGK